MLHEHRSSRPKTSLVHMQGGSSFNALVRAMKQQVVDTNTGVRDPNLLFEINKLSMNKVQVFPDGELDVQARSSAPHSAAFARPTTTSRPLRAQPPRALAAGLHGVSGMPHFLHHCMQCGSMHLRASLV
jgi:hypothetical protein